MRKKRVPIRSRSSFFSIFWKSYCLKESIAKISTPSNQPGLYMKFEPQTVSQNEIWLQIHFDSKWNFNPNTKDGLSIRHLHREVNKVINTTSAKWIIKIGHDLNRAYKNLVINLPLVIKNKFAFFNQMKLKRNLVAAFHSLVIK